MNDRPGVKGTHLTRMAEFAALTAEERSFLLECLIVHEHAANPLFLGKPDVV